MSELELSGKAPVSLPESFRTVPVLEQGSFVRRGLAFLGPGALVAVGYMDPGNWATDIAGGSAFGYSLLSVILLSNLMAILLQTLAVRLGIAGGVDLAQACRLYYGRLPRFFLWGMAEIAIIATDLAEVIGTAIALQLLFGIPLFWGVCLTVLDVLIILMLQRRGFRQLEALIIGLIAITGACFAFQLALAEPSLGPMLRGFLPTAEIVTNGDMLYIAMGIVGATVMPHNLYLHSSIVQTRRFRLNEAGQREAIRFASLDTAISLALAFLINAGILVLAAATFHRGGFTEIAGIEEAHAMLSPLLGGSAAAIAFAIALLATGQSSTITATLAGQIVMEGFLAIRLPAWARRLLTRAIALVPALMVTAAYGADGVAALLVLSQVVLSLQLPFAVVPLIHFTSSRRIMGPAASSNWLRLPACAIALLLIVLNVKLISDAVF